MCKAADRVYCCVIVHYVNVSLFVCLQLIDIWVVCSLGLEWISLLWTILHMSFDEPTCTSPQNGFTSSQGSHRFTFIDKTCFQSDCTNLHSQGVPVATLPCWHVVLLAFNFVPFWQVNGCIWLHFSDDFWSCAWFHLSIDYLDIFLFEVSILFLFLKIDCWCIFYWFCILDVVFLSLSLCLLSPTHFVSCLFTFLMLICFDEQEFLIFIKYKLSID